nr:DHH family phosphoesterase [Enterococcus timonensis]
MDKKVRKQFLLSVLLTILLEVVTVVWLPTWQIKVLLIMMINLLLAVSIYRVIKLLHQSNEERIKIATARAEEGITSAVNTLPVGIIAYDSKNRLQWANPYAILQLGESEYLKTTAGMAELIAVSEKNKPYLTYEARDYLVVKDTENQLLYFQEITRENELRQKNLESRLVIGILALDNYDEVTDKMDEKEISYLNSFLTTYISDWMNEHQVFYKRINSERYFFSCQYQDLEVMMEKKFDLLDIMRKATNEQAVPITISMGIAYGTENPEKIGAGAQSNLDMALVRGGDQVVVKEEAENSKAQYFGGKTSSNIKRTRVRSRAIGTALGELMDAADSVFIMGHNYPDMDVIGAAFGVAALAGFHEKASWVVIDPAKMIPDVEKALKEIQKYPELAKKIVTPQEAMQRKSTNSLLVMVDYNRPSLSVSPAVYESFERVAVIDHHRRGEEFPKSPLLVYLESSASSASELVAELIDFQDDRRHQITKLEATLLYGGMVVDTKSFKVRTTSRTFDIASFLKAKGADLSLAEYLLSSDLQSYLDMSRLISKTEYITKDIVIVTGKEDQSYDPVTAAKAADTLLGLQDIHASFVITKRTDGQVGISARSNGSVNVQVIMEDLGGGGHFTNAAVQLKTSVADAKEQLLAVIEKNKENQSN